MTAAMRTRAQMSVITRVSQYVLPARTLRVATSSVRNRQNDSRRTVVQRMARPSRTYGLLRGYAGSR